MCRYRTSSCLTAILLLTALVAACTTRPESGGYEATIKRTSYGIPHIEAADWGSLGFGEGYAFAQDHLCSLADQIIHARGERAKHFGRGENDAYLHSDLTMRALGITERAKEDFDRSDPEIQEWIRGYAAGYNHYIAETGWDSVEGWCSSQPWVEEITGVDVMARMRLLWLTGVHLSQQIATAGPPGSPQVAARDLPPEFEIGSNGWAVGSERSEKGGGMLMANPHYPWVGSNRFWEKHLTIPGKLNAYGMSLLGTPGVLIGFNENVAWTHTVSAGKRFTLYTLDLVPGDPTSYRYDGETRSMTKREIRVNVLEDDGSLTEVTRTLYFSHYGPILNMRGFEWIPERALTFRDANEDNEEAIATYKAMNLAAGMDDFQAAQADHNGIPFINTMAASRDGRAWYADTSAAPNLSKEAIEAWQARLKTDPATRGAYAQGMILLDGSNSLFEWVDDPRARDPGVVPVAEAPQLERRDYVFNANDSYWMSHAEELLTGYSPVHGGEGTARSLRTRMNATTLSNIDTDGPAGEDGKFSLQELADAALSNRGYAAMLLRSEVVERCTGRSRIRLDGETVDIGEACKILDNWDGRLNLDSVGAVLWREFITRYNSRDLRRAGALFAENFDPGDPVNTPRGLAAGGMALQKLAEVVRLLNRAGIALDTPLGELQYNNKNDGRIPIHGGLGGHEGVENVVSYGRNGTTLEPDPPLAPRVEGSRYLTEQGYPINRGTSFIMAMEFTREGPRGWAFMTYGQSGDPGSPHFTDQTRLFSMKEWRPILFRPDQIQKDPNLSILEIEAAR